jgi:predicted KAP-like P-loop ATPase
MDTKLLTNKELEDYANEDSFDFLIKADAIKIFLVHNSTSLERNKMLVLYGDWGSGKTSLMRHIETTIDKKIYFPIFFHAWEHEKDENLPLSLCDALINSLNGNSKIIKNFMKGAFTTLKSFTNGITLKTSGVLSGLGVDFEFSGEKVIDAIEKSVESSEPISFYKSNKEFKENFRKVEDLLLKNRGHKKF